MYNQFNNPYQQIHTPYVNGKAEADKFNIPLNSDILLLDNTNPIVYLKKTDQYGNSSTYAFSITPIEPEKPISLDDLNSINERLKRLEDMLNGKSNNGVTESKQQSVNYRNNKQH